VNDDSNVLPFDPVGRGGMARRGAPDKNGTVSAETLVLECPLCASELRLDSEWTDGVAEILCGRCDVEIPLAPERQESGAG
jgi:hypothetical protein